MSAGASRRRPRRDIAVVLGLALLAAGAGTIVHLRPAARAWKWDLPSGFPEPRVPRDNPMSEAKVELGRRLFYERRLSGNATMACASCHRQELAFTDGLPHAVGSTAQHHVRNSMGLTNVAYASRLTWASPLVDRLEDQALLPMFGDDPIELGLPDAATVVARLASDPDYRARFREAFPEDLEPLSLRNLTRALAAFERTLISGRSPYDRYVGGEQEALSPAARRGMTLFLSERLECFHCHGGFNFADAVDHAGLAEPERAFHNTGLYDVDGRGSYPSRDTGLHRVTGRPADMGRFRTPSLRNVAVTAPYMHDGSIATLPEVIDHYAAGGRRIDTGADAGDGFASPRKDPFLVGFVLSDREKQDLLTFLESLTDDAFLTDPRFGDPFSTAGSKVRTF